MDKTKNRIDLSSIAGLKSGDNLNSKKLHHGLLDAPKTKVIDEVQLSITDQHKGIKIMIAGQEKSLNAARNSGQRAYAKKISRKSHYITKK